MNTPTLTWFLTAAWRPLLDPLSLHEPWQGLLFLPPIIIAIALVYKTLKTPDLRYLVRETTQLSAYILILLIFAAVILQLLSMIA